MSDPVAEALLARLRDAVKGAGSIPKFSELTGIPKDTLNKYLAGSQPGPAALVRIAEGAGISVDALLGRAGSDNALYGSIEDIATGDQATDSARALRLVRADQEDIPEGFVPVPYFDVRASAGRGRATLPAETIASAHFLFAKAWLRSLGVAPENAELLHAEGDSMSPTICDGDLMLADRGYGDPIHGKIYALVVRDLVVVKRINFLATGGMMLISDNDRYPTETIRRDEVDELNFQGRIAWYGRAI